MSTFVAPVTLADRAIASGDLVSVTLSRPTAGPPAGFRVAVSREQRGVLSRGDRSCATRVRVTGAASRRVLASVRVEMERRWLALGGWDCEGTAGVALAPDWRAASEAVVLSVLDAYGVELARSAPFRLDQLAQAGASSPVVDDDRGVLERAAGAAGSAGRFAGDTFNKALWAGGIAGGIVLLMLGRR